MIKIAFAFIKIAERLVNKNITNQFKYNEKWRDMDSFTLFKNNVSDFKTTATELW